MSSEQHFRQFLLDEIKEATRDFDEELIIGKGGFGVVYIGSINSGTELVAIKRLSYGSTQGEIEFLREIETLFKLRHNNLVRLQGYCNESPEKILVYEYIPNGTLADHLYKINGSASASAMGDNQTSRLTWEQRLNICIGTARGLDFLHREHVPGIIHRDIKDSNILLDEYFEAKIADFGLAKLVKNSSSELQTTIVSSTGVKGTFGYLDPEYFYTQRLSKKTDVYAFGVVLLVILCGRRAVDNKAGEDQRSLTEWAKKCIQKNRTDQIIDPHLAGKISSSSLKIFLKVSQKCLSRQSEQRPTMEEVVAALELALAKQPVPGLALRQPSVRANLTQTMMAKLQLVFKKKQPGKEKFVQSVSLIESLCHKFSLDEIKTATDNFNEALIIGKGRAGVVYLGRINNGAEYVAIKRFGSQSMLDMKRFLGEIDTLPKLQHDHVICLKGYCYGISEMILVYEYMTGGNLENHLYELQAPLTWEQRLNICIGAARGLDFLHEGVEPGLIHRDFKCSNIMLDENFVPKIRGFGQVDDDSSSYVVNSIAYVDPEYVRTLRPTAKSDVYSFGVVMLVILSGRRALLEGVSNDGTYLVRWAEKCLSWNMIDVLIDPEIRGQVKSESLEEFMGVAKNCLHRQPENRHSMANVVEGLQLALKKQVASTSTPMTESYGLRLQLPDNVVQHQEYSGEGEYLDEGEYSDSDKGDGYAQELYEELLEECSEWLETSSL